MTTENFVIAQWVYAGRRAGIDTDKKECAVDRFYPIDGNTLLEFVSFTADKKKKTIGGVYQIKVSPDGLRAVTGSAPFVRLYDGPEVAAWRAESDAYELTQQRAKLERSGKDLHLETLEPLREAYKRLPFNQRDAFELLVLRYLRRAG